MQINGENNDFGGKTHWGNLGLGGLLGYSAGRDIARSLQPPEGQDPSLLQAIGAILLNLIVIGGIIAFAIWLFLA